jgi:hypothetical protein
MDNFDIGMNLDFCLDRLMPIGTRFEITSLYPGKKNETWRKEIWTEFEQCNQSEFMQSSEEIEKVILNI